MRQTIKIANPMDFQFVFRRYITPSTSYLLDNFESDKSICGYIEKNRFQIWQNIGIRNFKMITYGVLHGIIQEDGSLVYYFKKRKDGFIFSIAMAIFSVVIGILASYNLNNIVPILPSILIACIAIFLANYHSKKDRQQLLAVLDHMIYEIANGKNYKD